MMNKVARSSILLTLFLLSVSPAQATTRTASNSSELNAAIAASAPGDTIIMTNGNWSNVVINFNAKATASQPIVLRAKTPGNVILNGASKITFSAPYLIADGLLFRGGALTGGAIVSFISNNCRLTNSAIIDYNPADRSTSYYWVNFDGSDNRVDNCYFKGKNHHQPAVGNDFSGSRHNTVDHCYFKDMRGSGNGSEIFRIWGYGRNEELGTDGAFFTIENNLFDAADGEGLEMISLKSNRNIVRYNTIKNTKGEITSRSGNFNTIEGNFIFGNNKAGSRGIRITGQYHKIINNYIENVAEAGIVVYTGEYIDTYLTPNYQPILRNGTPLGRVPAYGQVKNAIIAHNTIVNPGGAGMDIGAAYKVGWPTSQRVLLPENCTIANNVIIKNGGTAIRTPKQDVNPPLDIFTFQPNIYEGNVVHGGTLSMNPAPASGITFHDPLISVTEGLYRPANNSPLINAGSGSHVTNDMDGQTRDGNPDIGADEASAEAIIRRPLTSTDVGPQWVNTLPPDDPGDDGGSPPSTLDITNNGGIITAQYENTSKPSENYPSVIDNKITTKYFMSGKTALWIQYKSTVPAVVIKYTITSANDVPERDPKNWSLLASNDGLTWTTLDTRAGELFASRALTQPYTITNNTTSFLYYRLDITANNGSTGTQLAEWELFKVEGSDPEPEPDPNSPFDITDNGGITSAQYANTSKPSENFPSLTDNSILTKYFISNRTALWIQYKSTSPAIVVRYTITSANDVPTRDPKNWALQGSNNGSSWVTLDARSNEVFPTRRETRTFSFASTTSYIYYRLNITANNGSSGTQLSEWELYQRKTQKITIPDIDEKTYGDDPFEVIATASSSLAVTLEVVSGPAMVSGDSIAITGAGTVTIRATQSGNDNYFPATAEKIFIVNKAAQNLELDPIETKTYGDAPFELSAVSETNELIVLEVVSGPATISGTVLTITGAGEVTIRASQAETENYLPASVEQTFTVNKAPQVITFEIIETKTYGDAPFTLFATSDAGLPVVFEWVAGPATITDATLTITGAGEVTVRASAAENENYLPASAEQTFTVNKAEQTITFEAIAPKHDQDVIMLSATSTSGLPVVFDVISGPGVLNGNSLSFSGDGVVMIEASQPGNENYLPASTVEQSVLVYADDNKKDGIRLIVHPNPTKGKLKIKLDNKKDKQYTFAVYDEHGNIVDTTVIPKSHKMFDVDFDLSESPNGIYYIWVSDGAEVTVRRIIKE